MDALIRTAPRGKVMTSYHGPHVPSRPEPDAKALSWRPGIRWTDRERIRAHSCSCRGVVYEFVGAAGQYFIRRTTLQTGAVEETERMLAVRAEQMWADLFAGRVH
ncbi:hypothetical protein Aph01nite_76460 [Acrocarpospora phusangensis]|uniref:Uncharacterized protein n=2 Tax=Acrocarpospora phusangensis TaxID=1070424 RepID=A0A919QI97_9ACTN|nr:hypothetical protein Aph01nite_76460 [Acrocarpospora phusangensis]